jgi:AcrR family transcriptional regulator
MSKPARGNLPLGGADVKPESGGRRPTAVRKREIVRIAARLFAKNGYHGTGISELSDEVGLGKGALYYHIRSKEDLLYEISSEHVEAMIDIGEALLERTDLTPTEKLRELSLQLMITIGERLPEVTVFFREFENLSEPRAGQIRKRRSRFEQIWQEIIAAGIKRGEFRPVDPIAIKGLLGLHNYSYIWFHENGRCSPEQISEIFMDLVLSGLGAAPTRNARRAPNTRAIGPL